MGWSDQDYKKAFSEGHTRNEYVARIVRNEGLWADCPPLKYAKNKDEIKDFTFGEKDVVTRAGTLEVKGQGKYFTSEPSSFPFSTMIVDTVWSWEGKIEKPVAYVFVCIENNECLVVPGSTKPQWQVRKLFDNKKKITDSFYVAPKSCLRRMDDLLSFLRRREMEWNLRGADCRNE